MASMKKGKLNIIKTLGSICCAFLFAFCSSEKIEESQGEKKSKPNEISAASDEKQVSEETVMIGDFDFAEKNLSTKNYRNGDPISQAKNKDEWNKFAEKKEGCWAYPDFDESKSLENGLVYSGYVVSDKRGLAPKGWKIPSSDEWREVIELLGGKEMAGKKLKSDTDWKKNGDNSSGFNAKPIPFFAADFNHQLQVVYFWSSTIAAPEYHEHFDLFGEKDELIAWYDHDSWGLSVRCMKE